MPDAAPTVWEVISFGSHAGEVAYQVVAGPLRQRSASQDDEASLDPVMAAFCSHVSEGE